MRKRNRKAKKKRNSPVKVKEKVYKSRVGAYIEGKSKKVGKYTERVIVKGSAGKS